MQVKITQFLAPNGAQTSRLCEVPDDCEEGYESIKKHGCRLTAEVLMTGMVSQTIEHEDGDILIEVTKNGPEVKDALVKMLREFNDNVFDEWIKAVQGE